MEDDGESDAIDPGAVWCGRAWCMGAAAARRSLLPHLGVRLVSSQAAAGPVRFEQGLCGLNGRVWLEQGVTGVRSKEPQGYPLLSHPTLCCCCRCCCCRRHNCRPA